MVMTMTETQTER